MPDPYYSHSVYSRVMFNQQQYFIKEIRYSNAYQKEGTKIKRLLPEADLLPDTECEISSFDKKCQESTGDLATKLPILHWEQKMTRACRRVGTKGRHHSVYKNS